MDSPRSFVAQSFTATFIDDYRFLCENSYLLVLWDFAVESKPKTATFWVSCWYIDITIKRNYGLNDIGLFDANPGSGIVVLEVHGPFNPYALVIPTDFFVGFDFGDISQQPKRVTWEEWKGFVMQVPIGGSRPYVFHTQLFLLRKEGGRGNFDVYDFSPYTRMEVKKGNITYNPCGDRVTGFTPKPNLLKALATTCSGRFNLNNTPYYVTEDGVLFLTVRTPAVAKRTRLLTRFTSQMGHGTSTFLGFKDQLEKL